MHHRLADNNLEALSAGKKKKKKTTHPVLLPQLFSNVRKLLVHKTAHTMYYSWHL